MSEFKVGSRVYLSKDSQFIGGNDQFNPLGVVGVIDSIKVRCELPVNVVWSNGKANDYNYDDLYLAEPIYNPEQSDYIAELECRVTELEELCEDYAKIVAEKDDHMKHLERQVKLSEPLFAKTFKLVDLVSKDGRVAQLLGANVGDDVLEVIYDYLIEQTKE